jgi:putative sterol carrier protein
MANLPTNRSELRDIVKGKADADILAGAKGNEEAYIEGILNAMPGVFDAAKAGNQAATFQYDIDTPVGMKQYQIIVEGGKCTIAKGPAGKAKCTLKSNLPTFLRIMSGDLDGQKAFMSGVLKISGDVMFSRNMTLWFKG